MRRRTAVVVSLAGAAALAAVVRRRRRASQLPPAVQLGRVDGSVERLDDGAPGVAALRARAAEVRTVLETGA